MTELSLQTRHVYVSLKRPGNQSFDVVSTWKTNTWCVCRIDFIITRFLSLVYENVEKKVKKLKHSKASHSKKPGREKAQNFTVGINITPPNYSSISGNCFNLLFCTQLMSDTSYWSQQNTFSGHRQSLSDALSVFFLFYSFYCNILIALKCI